MRYYLLFSLLLLIMLMWAMVATWGETNKTIMYGTAMVGVIGLMTIKSTEKRMIEIDFQPNRFRQAVD